MSPSLSPSLSPAVAEAAAALPALGEEPSCLVPVLHLWRPQLAGFGVWVVSHRLLRTFQLSPQLLAVSGREAWWLHVAGGSCALSLAGDSGGAAAAPSA